MLLDVTADLFCRVRLRIAAERPRPATQAGARAGFLRLLGTRIERHIVAPRTPRRTRRPAIDAGTGHGEDELSIANRVARDDRVPAQVIAWLGRVGARYAHGAGCVLNEYGI